NRAQARPCGETEPASTRLRCLHGIAPEGCRSPDRTLSRCSLRWTFDRQSRARNFATSVHLGLERRYWSVSWAEISLTRSALPWRSRKRASCGGTVVRGGAQPKLTERPPVACLF